jgi:hypothetical protein
MLDFTRTEVEVCRACLGPIKAGEATYSIDYPDSDRIYGRCCNHAFAFEGDIIERIANRDPLLIAMLKAKFNAKAQTSGKPVAAPSSQA